MRLTAENYDIGIAEPTALLHEDDCRIIGIREGDHVRIEGHGCVTAIASMSDTLVRRGTVMIACGVLGGHRRSDPGVRKGHPRQDGRGGAVPGGDLADRRRRGP